MTVPPYPRIPHLIPGRGTRDDRVLDAGTARNLLEGEAVVEEKLDGASASIWLEPDGPLRYALRGGSDTRDRAGQLGPLRAWLAANDVRVRQVCAAWPAVYAEWMLLTHSVYYDRLPSYLVILDLWDPDRGFANVVERDAVCEAAAIAVPPQLWRGVPQSVQAIERLIGPSTWGTRMAEGVVVRRVGPGEPRMAKLLRAGFSRLGDDQWKAGRPRNRLVGGEVSWR